MIARRLIAAAALVAAALAAAPPAPAQAPGRAGRPSPFVPDSIVHRVLASGSASLVRDPVADPAVPRIWLTRAERTRWAQTSDYEETVRFCRQLEAGSRWIQYAPFGRSGQGRELPLLVVSRDRLFTPEAARAAGRPVVLILNGIHPGEIEGKDASLMLLRDLGVLQKTPELLDSCVVLVVPIFSVDGHERRGRYNRINQNGPVESGWRHTPIGLNLNRDWTKADAPEMQALLGNVYSRWWPDLLVDDHTTDGGDYRYDVTYTLPHGPDAPEPIRRWSREAFEGRVVPRLAAMGHLPEIYLDDAHGDDPAAGVEYNELPPRFSTGYPPLQCRAAVLVETHMLKPYGARVKATYDVLLALLEELHAHPRALTDAVRESEAAAIARGAARGAIALTTQLSERTEPFPFKGVVTHWETSDISGGRVPRFTSTPWDTTLSLRREVVADLTVRQPAGYLVPQEWSDVVARLALHGIRTRRLARAWSDTVEMARIADPRVAPQAYEGRHLVAAGAVTLERQVRAFRPGDVWVPLDQRSGALAVHLLEAQAPDGFMAWGFFETIFQRKEFGEAYVVEPLARAMLANDPKLAAEFHARLASDTTFARDPAARLDFFYRRSPWGDPEQNLDPIARALRRPPDDALAPEAAPGGTPGR